MLPTEVQDLPMQISIDSHEEEDLEGGAGAMLGCGPDTEDF